MSHTVEVDYILKLYERAFNETEGTDLAKHIAGLIAVVEGTQPNVIYPRIRGKA